jgi:hypothetical protein
MKAYVSPHEGSVGGGRGVSEVGSEESGPGVTVGSLNANIVFAKQESGPESAFSPAPGFRRNLDRSFDTRSAG